MTATVAEATGRKNVLRFDRGTCHRQVLRGACGAGLVGVAAIAVPSHWLAGLLTGTAVLFAWYGARGWLRLEAYVTPRSYGFDMVRTGFRGSRTAIRWDDLQTVKLRYYAPRRDGSEGWFVLRLTSDGGSVTVDSSLDAFEMLLERAADAARHRNLPFDDATEHNLAHFFREPLGGGAMTPGDRLSASQPTERR